MIVLDAAGLALFAVAGTQKALIYKMHPFIAILLGTITGVGGGTIRDMFLARIPTFLRADVYATAAMAGSAAMIVGRKLGLPPALSAILWAVSFVLRCVWSASGSIGICRESQAKLEPKRSRNCDALLLLGRRVVRNHYLRLRARGVSGAGSAGNFSQRWI
jgi:Glycine transporter